MLILLGSIAQGEEFAFFHEQVLGSSLEFRGAAPTEWTASQAEQTMLVEIERLRTILSTWDRESEISQWLAQPATETAVSADLWQVLQLADQWEQKSQGVFNPRIAAVAPIWKAAAERGQLPTDSQIAQIASLLSQPAWRLDRPGFATRIGHTPITLDAVAKGYILDRVCEQLQERHPDLDRFVLNLGGDMRIVGASQRIGVADPSQPAENAKPLTQIVVPAGHGTATSGGYRRFFEIAGKRYSHILDPRTGRPVEQVTSATVVAKTAAEADAAATVLSVLEPNAGLRWIAAISDCECFLVDAAGREYRSPGWRKLEIAGEAQANDATPRVLPAAEQVAFLADGEKQRQLVVDFTLQRPDTFRYRRPYLAIWLEDEEGYPVKTALLWMLTEGSGYRWHRELTRWYRNDRVRKEKEGKELIGVITGATRGPGDYKAVFDGTDNQGRRLAAGQYLLCIEIAREHGDYKLLRKRVELGDGPLEPYEFKENREIKARFTYDFPPAKQTP